MGMGIAELEVDVHLRIQNPVTSLAIREALARPRGNQEVLRNIQPAFQKTLHRCTLKLAAHRSVVFPQEIKTADLAAREASDARLVQHTLTKAKPQTRIQEGANRTPGIHF